jgi:DNA invertase Pin-like site-specific DNA recombinase
LHFFTDERVKAGLANARAKGKLIGRKKMRDSDLIRKLLKAGMTFRQIAQIARCSHGSVWAEKSAMMKEEAEKTLAESLPDAPPQVIFPEVTPQIAA